MKEKPRSNLLLFGLFWIQITGISCLQTFDREPVSTEVNPGSDTKLDCKVLNKKGSCSWQKDNKPVGIYFKKYEWVNADETSGDCSLWIRSATLDFDDGEWECQITASDFTTQDALTSRPVRLIVRVEPQAPRIEYKASAVLPGHNVTVKAGEKASVKCVSRYGNPPAKLKWFLGDDEIVAKSNQSNSPEVDNRRTWSAVSIVEIAAEKAMNGRMLRCVALHESYPAKSMGVDVRLDVTYSPEVRLVGTPPNDVEEGRDHVVLKCITDSNPPASVIWRRVGKQEIASLEESLQFRPVFRRDSGTYTCQAQNSIGSSQPISVALDVKYAPDIESIRPDRVTTSQLFHPVTFTCAANGNPAPSYEWIQKIPTSLQGEFIEVIRSSESRLHIANITYEHQGEYFCRATNVINGNEKRKLSDGITLQVVGPPHIIRHVGGREIVVMRGEDALVRLVVCADPRPRNSTWLWGSVQVQPGSGVGKYQADDLNQDRREDCYEARLHISDVDIADSRNYYLSVENDRGYDKYGVHLAVRGSYQEPLAMATLLSIATGCLLVFLLCVLMAVYAIRSERCCFGRKCRGDFRPTDLESEKSDIDSTMGRKTPRIEASMMGNGPITIPGEAMYCSSPARRQHPQHTILAGSSPEAIKVRRAAMVLQAPTMV
uniref:Kin of IRRE-like protein 3 n=1 Tax=Cacopsylla melanoneura TaxID=428564 RepID=A0A8D8Z044_9HEMI